MKIIRFRCIILLKRWEDWIAGRKMIQFLPIQGAFFYLVRHLRGYVRRNIFALAYHFPYLSG